MRNNKPAMWAIINLTGLVITVTGMFGIVGLLAFENTMTVFVIGTALTLVSIAAILKIAHNTNRIKPSKRCGLCVPNEDEDE